MGKQANQKLKLLYLRKILLERTDDSHGLTMPELLGALEEYGVAAERKSVYDDLEALRVYGMDVGFDGRRYAAVNRAFELPELKLLVDAVQSSRFITRKKSEALIKKVEGLASLHEARALQRQVYVANRIKAVNERIYYNIDQLHEAISTQKQISFRYFEWVVDFSGEAAFKKQYRHDGSRYRISPWALTWDDENYYLIGFDARAGIIKHYRVDKMEDIRPARGKRDGREIFERFDMALYSKRVFGMFGGKEEDVRIRFSNRLIGVVIDRFGKDAFLGKVDQERFYVLARVQVSPQFLSWVLGFGAEAKILSPGWVAQRLQEQARDALAQYGETT